MRYNVCMTRVNVIPVYELSDQHLIAEYRELPRTIKQDINVTNASNSYILGTGHMRWACNHQQYTFRRFIEICKEMHFRGFKTNFDPKTLLPYLEKCPDKYNEYTVSAKDIELNRARIRDKYNQQPNLYRWTRRKKPDWIEKTLA